MTAVLFTTDTELSMMLQKRGASALENFRIAIMGEVADGAWGVGHHMKRLSAHGLQGVFFVEALSSQVLGLDILKRIVDVVREGGHEVQLHLHTEWLQWIEKDVVGSRRGTNIADFSYDDQRRLLEVAIEALTKAGAPAPTAFRAGNYGANNDTLRALASFGVVYDSSYNEPFLHEACGIKTPRPLINPAPLDGLTEVPITHFEDYPGHNRPLQVCAASYGEFKIAISQSIAQRRPTVVVVNHSFELLNVNRTRANRMLVDRFDRYCAYLQENLDRLTPADFRSLKLDQRPNDRAQELKSNPVRTAIRMVEQYAGAILYDRA